MTTAFFRTVILYFFIMTGLRLTGKRQIGELEPSELVLTMMLSDLATVPMQDFGVPLIFGIISILTLLCFSTLLSHLSLCSVRFRELLCGSPTVLIDKGVFLQSALRKNRFTIDELYEELRAQGISDPSHVKYAILENSGQLSVLQWPAYQPPSADDLKRTVKDNVSIPTVLINDGRLLSKNLQKCGKPEAWLAKELKARGFADHRAVFLFTLDDHGNIFCIAKEGVS